MRGVLWVGVFWALTLAIWYWRSSLHSREIGWRNRESFALIIILLGTKSIAAQTSAEEVLQDPIVLERVIRGGLALLAVLLAGPLLIARVRQPTPRPQLRNITVLGLYIGIAALSVIYSAAPLVTAAKAFELGAAFIPIVAAALATDGLKRLKNMATLVVVLEGGLLVVAVIGFFAYPTAFSSMESRPGFLSPLTMNAPYAHPNVLSAIGALLGTYSLARWLDASSTQSKLLWQMWFAFGLAGTFLAAGRQGVVMLLIATFVLLWFKRRAVFLTLIGPTLVAAAWVNWDSALRIFSRGRPVSTAALTGRLAWWESALEVWTAHPWTGYGYGAGGRFVALASIGRGQTSNVHSGYIEALVGVGIIGVLPLLVVVAVIAAWSIRAFREGALTAIAILIVPIAIHTSVDLGFGGWLKPDFVILACLAGIADWCRNEKKYIGEAQFASPYQHPSLGSSSSVI